MTARARVAWWLRCWADRLDPDSAPRALGMSFTFEDRTGIVFRDDGRGCPLWHLGHADYERAHDEAGGLCPERRTLTRWLPNRWPPRPPF